MLFVRFRGLTIKHFYSLGYTGLFIYCEDAFVIITSQLGKTENVSTSCLLIME